MRTLPSMMIGVLAPFAPLFSERVFEHVQVLLSGAILAPGNRTVSSALRAMGLDQQKTFHRYHRVLSYAVWSSREASRVLLGSLVEAFVAEGEPLVVGIDETLERRQGKKISAKGIYRDPARSSRSHLVKITEWAWQMLLQLRRWQPHHEIIAVADGGYASLKLLDRCRSGRHHPPNSPKFSCEPLNFGEFTFFALG